MNRFERALQSKKMPLIHTKISTDIQPEDLNQLRFFHDRVVALSNTKLVKGRDSKINASLQISRESGLQISVTLPPEEQLAQFLMAFRFFYLKKEPTFFPRIINLVHKYADTQYNEISKDLKTQWNDSLFKNSASIKLNGKPISASQLIDLWFNAHYFHGDMNKREELDEINSLLREDICKYMLVDSVYNASDAVRRFHAGIGALFLPVGTAI